MEPWEQIAREEIRDLVARYTHLGDGGRVEEVAELFEPDGVLETRGPTGAPEAFVGRRAIAAFLGGLAEGHVAEPGITYVRHHVSNVLIDLTSRTEASGSSYWLVVNNRGLWRWGRYRDVYREAPDGRWRFARRTVRRDEGPPPI